MIFILAIICMIFCGLAIKKANAVIREARAILQDIEAHHDLLIEVARREARRNRFRRLMK